MLFRSSMVHERFLENRREALPGLSDPFGVPAIARVVLENPRDSFRSSFPWKRNVIATVFWVGELPTENNPTPNTQSAWDQNWQANFGGYDQPDQRQGYLPAGFTPSLNPFYVALPYNDVAKGGVHRPEASEVIPWFWEAYRGDGISVCKGRWLAIHRKGRVCYAQWEDAGPFTTDDADYVFVEMSDKRFRLTPVELAPAQDDMRPVLKGLTEGTEVVTEGAFHMNNERKRAELE